MPQRNVINASVSPKGSLETLSQREVQQLSEVGTGSLYTLFRQCALAILNTGAHVDNAKTILEAYKDFEVRIHQQDRGVRLELLNAPADAFVDGEMIASTREMLFSALRDIVYTESELASQRKGAIVGVIAAAALPEQVERLALIDGLLPYTTPAEEIAEKLGKALLAELELPNRRKPVYATVEDAVA